MQNELIFFIDQTEISIFKMDSQNYENIKIKGEELFQYYSLDESLIFLEEYLKNVIGFHSYDDYSLFIFSKNEINVNQREIQNIFNVNKITFLSLDVIKAYQDVLNAQYGEKAKELQNKLDKQLDEKEKVKNILSDIKDDYKTLKELLTEKDKENKELAKKAKLWDNYLLEKSKINRDIIYTNDATKGENNLNLKAVGSIKLSKANGENVNKNQRIGRGCDQNSFYRKIAIWKSSREGYIYWLSSNREEEIPFKDFQIKDKKGNIALAVISDSPDDKIEDILQFVKSEINKEIKISKVK